jgi:neural Wiskott-Aldrich syndrome protein
MMAEGLSRIAMSSGLAASLSRATDYARARGHGEVTLEHMLLALCDDHEAALVLAASNVNVAELVAEVGAQLANFPTRSQMPDVDLVVASDMRRILEAAAAAARGGRRREINGAIVLAAIVGDGKSAAAQVLSNLGMTFEGAIRALQSKPTPEPGSEQRALPAPNAEAILAGARERVQSRTGVTPRRQLPNAESTYEDAAEREPEPLQVEETFLPSPAAEEAESTYQHRYAPPTGYEPEPPFEPEAAPETTPYREVEAQQEAPAYEHAPFPAGSYEGFDESPPRPASAPFPPPLPVPDGHDSWMPPPSPAPASGSRFGPPPPPPGGPPLPPASSLSSGAPRSGPPPLAPWPEAERRRPEGIGAASGGPSPHSGREGQRSPPAAKAANQAPARSFSPRTEIGQLVENIPRSMRVAVPALIEVRIARADVQALAEGLQGGGAAYQHEVTVTKAMSVRLRAPDGGFFIETASPETQWIEKAMLLSSDDFASWRWHVTPRDKGRRRLQLIISARTVSADGLAAETALPDQVITVRVRTNYVRSAKRWVGWILAAVAGGVLAKFGEGAFEPLIRLITG